MLGVTCLRIATEYTLRMFLCDIYLEKGGFCVVGYDPFFTRILESVLGFVACCLFRRVREPEAQSVAGKWEGLPASSGSN